MNICNFHQFETIKYAESLDIQRTIFNEMIEQKKMGKTPKHHLFFVEHPAVYTLGKHANATNFILQPDALKAIGADIHEIERGGDITFHGPGQLVVYPLFDLEQLNIGLKRYVQLIEKCIIDTLKEFEITAGVIDGRVGVWIDMNKSDERKIAAIGIKSSRYVTMHGLALNVNTDLNYFNHIVPCGIVDKGVTSMQKELNDKIDMLEVINKMKYHFRCNFELTEI
jgi:lipoyl(octanoyl) transferase